ncbi:unnamed protein product [Schistocephalus solidus]|uniref:Rho-GAP domain-containing protein n=1 Tax=Schistocephalus solidus TaxID=70667 RepID=A0A183TRB6_SCHSO|nr:unnamed protein product [Schistocephalus solidus]
MTDKDKGDWNGYFWLISRRQPAIPKPRRCLQRSSHCATMPDDDVAESQDVPAGANIQASNATTNPLSSAKKQQNIRHTLKLSNCCPPNEFPQVPAIVIHCVTDVANRGLQQVGIYRISGAVKPVQELYLKFMNWRVTPNLALVEDIDVICSCLKMFFSALDEPLVTYAIRPKFAEVAKLAESEPEVFKFHVAMILDRLPPVYRDTLSFLMLHLKAVSRSSACRMGEENLARIFGPTIFGYSSSDPTPMQVASEIPTQQSIVRLLFSVPDSVFSTVLNSYTGSARTSCQSSKSGSTHFQSLYTPAIGGSTGNSTVPVTLPLSSATTTHNDVTTHGRFFKKSHEIGINSGPAASLYIYIYIYIE